MSCWNCEDGLVMVCPDDICRGLGYCQLVNPCKDGLRICQVCGGDEDYEYDQCDDQCCNSPGSLVHDPDCLCNCHN